MGDLTKSVEMLDLPAVQQAAALGYPPLCTANTSVDPTGDILDLPAAISASAAAVQGARDAYYAKPLRREVAERFGGIN